MLHTYDGRAFRFSYLKPRLLYGRFVTPQPCPAHSHMPLKCYCNREPGSILIITGTTNNTT